MRRIIMGAALAALIASPAAADTLTPEQVIHRHITSGGNIDAIMADYADDAVVFQQGRAVQGKPAIREMFSRMFPPRPASSSAAAADAPKPPAGPPPRIWQEGEVGFMVAQFGPSQVTEQYLVRNGKILLQAIYAGAPPATR